jgi:CBS domain containing-hemolysin-like protein
MDPLLLGVEVSLLVLASAICSGLNIALMALDIGDLRRKAKLGNKQARRVLPLRRNTHLTLASILFTNVAAVSASSLVLEHRFNGWVAGFLSTILIVIFGEVMPQALFSKDPLAWTSRFAPVLYGMRFITYPLSKPLQILLDDLFPKERTPLQSRRELGLLITEHIADKNSELDDDEAEIMKGALSLSETRVRDIMTDIRHTYWLTPETELSGEKIDEIKHRGFSRIPVFNPEHTHCNGVLLMKDLVDVDFDDNHYRVSDMGLHSTEPVGSMTALDTLFRIFISAGSHLIPVEKEDHIIGIVTIEDLLEAIVGHEIEDETDRQKNRR